MHTLLANTRVLWLIIIISAGLGCCAAVGFRLGRRAREEEGPTRASQADMMVGGVLALLGLLLAFTFSIVQGRFDKRKELSIEAANAIGTAYLRAAMLPPPHDQRVQGWLREYTDLRLGHKPPDEFRRALARSDQLQALLWQDTVAMARANPTSQITGRFIESLNNMIDLQTTRLTVTLFQRLPGAIMVILLAVAALALGMVGYRSGLVHTRTPFLTSIVVVTIAAVLALIIDLDRPTARLFRVNQEAMRDTRAMMNH